MNKNGKSSLELIHIAVATTLVGFVGWITSLYFYQSFFNEISEMFLVLLVIGIILCIIEFLS